MNNNKLLTIYRFILNRGTIFSGLESIGWLHNGGVIWFNLGTLETLRLL